nr:hypothetical protein [Tanacetum cinerariifolium]
MKLFKTPSLDESSSLEFDLFSDLEEHFEEEITETMMETMEEYIYNTRGDYGSGVTRLKIDAKDHFELKGQFLKELCKHTFSGSDHEDANEHIEKVIEEVILFYNGLEVRTRQFLIQKVSYQLRQLPMQKLPSKSWSNILKNGTTEHLGQEVLKLLMDWLPSKHNLIILKEKSRRLMKRYMRLRWDVSYVRDPTTPKTVHLQKKEEPLKKHIILNLVYLSNKEGNI